MMVLRVVWRRVGDDRCCCRAALRGAVCVSQRACASTPFASLQQWPLQLRHSDHLRRRRGDSAADVTAARAAAAASSFAQFATATAAPGPATIASSSSSTSASHDAGDVSVATVPPSRSGGGALGDAAYAVHVVDMRGMPAELPADAPQTLDELEALCPATSPLRGSLRAMASSLRWTALTRVQQAAMAVALEGRDVLCVAPTATGKTFSYVFPCLLRMTLRDSHASGAARLAADTDASSSSSAPTPLRSRDVEALLRDKIASGQVCRYCELDVAVCRVCPLTGRPHPRAPPPSVIEASHDDNDDDSDEGSEARRRRRAEAAANDMPPMRLDDVAGVGQPQVLVLVPTAQLAEQVHATFRRLAGPYTVRYLVRAASVDEQRHHVTALQDADVVISTPTTLLPALLKHKLSLRRVHTLVLDEVDELASHSFFEPLKMVLGALPRLHARPQRLAFAASLPPPVYAMLRDRLLLPSHRFVLANVRRDALGYSILARPPPAGLVATSNNNNSSYNIDDNNKNNTANDGSATVCALSSNGGSSAAAGSLLSSATGVHTHVVYLLGRIEKTSKLTWMYTSGQLMRTQRTLVFCSTRQNVAYVYEHLTRTVAGLRCMTLTSHTSHTARRGVLKMFATGVSTCLICTDVCSRGIDFRGVVYVVHYDMPEDMATWLHRTGRCGRHGMPGYVYTFFQPENVRFARALVAHLRQHRQVVPPKLQELAKQSFVDVFKHSLLHSATRPPRKSDPTRATPALPRDVSRYPDYRQAAQQRQSRPL